MAVKPLGLKKNKYSRNKADFEFYSSHGGGLEKSLLPKSSRNKPVLSATIRGDLEKIKSEMTKRKSS